METNFDIKKSTSFKIGGEIARMYFPTSAEEFLEVIKAEPDAFVVGNLSNVLVSSFGYDGAVISMTKMDEIKIEGNKITAGAGVRGTKLSKFAAEKGLSGLEFMIAFPGSVGGEVFMNAGAHGQSISDVLTKAKLYSKKDGLLIFDNQQMDFSYRTSVCQSKGYSVLEAEFELHPKLVDAIQNKMNENLEFRQSRQPSLKTPNCGSIFRNPAGDYAGRLLESVNVKGLKIGGAKVWDNHANFIVNDGDATSLDVLKLMYEMYKRVKEKYDIELKPEIRFLGGNNREEVELCKILYQK